MTRRDPGAPVMLRIPRSRLRLWAVAVAIVGLVPVLGAPGGSWHDWPAFWSAGSLVGTRAVMDPGSQAAWQVAAGLPVAYFPYPPAAGWLFWPFAQVPIGAGFVLFGAVMLGAAVAAGWLGGRVFGLEPRAAVVAVLAWAPVTASIVIGQNGPLGLLLAIVSLAGLVAAEEGSVGALPPGMLGGRRADVLAGLGAGLACYKPTFGLPLVGLLLLRRRWTAFGVALVTLGGGFVLSVAAVGGDPGWPGDWAAAVGAYVGVDFAANADKAVSLPGLLEHGGVPPSIALLCGAVIVAAALPRLARAPAREAGAAACLVGVAASPHAWGYDAALLVPFLLLALGSPERWLPREPWRTRVVVLLYVLGPLWLVSRQTVVSGVAVAVVALAGLWWFGWLRGRPTRATT